MILFTADIHLKLGQKNVPREWAKDRYRKFFKQISGIEPNVDLHIIGGDLFDRLPTMEELELYFEWVSMMTVRTIITTGNHEATKKGHTFLSQLKAATQKINPLVTIVDDSYIDEEYGFGILPYENLHKNGATDFFPSGIALITHVRGEIPPHVKPEVDLSMFDKFKVVFAGDLHSHSNSQRNIVYPGSPMTTSFHRKEVATGYLLIDETDWSWEWHQLDLPQLIRKTVDSPEQMIPTTYHHTIYELEGDLKDLSNIENSELLDKKVVKRSSEASLIISSDMTLTDELSEYLSYILELDDTKVSDILGVFNDHSSKIEME